MKKKMNKDRLEQAVADFKALVIYYCVTRPQRCAEYMEGGKFSAKKLLHELDYLENWDSKSRAEKRFEAKSYARYCKAFNQTFGIPSRLVKKVLGWRDSDTRVKLPEVLGLCKDFIREIKQGCKSAKVDGGYVKKAWWCKKYLLASRKYWFRLLSDPRYSKLETIPYASDRVKKIIFDYIRNPPAAKPAAKEQKNMKNMKNMDAGMPHPENDVEWEEPAKKAAAQPECLSAKSKIFPHLQEFVDRLYISADEAGRMGRAYGSPVTFREHPSGWSVQDAAEHRTVRCGIFKLAGREFTKGMMGAADAGMENWLVRKIKENA